MGVDAVILFKLKDGVKELVFPRGCLPEDAEVKPIPDYYGEVGATHEVDQMWRFYGEGYERGPWATCICPTLQMLLSHLDVEKVWYGGDSNDNYIEITPDELNRITMHYLRWAERPYRFYSEKEKIVAKEFN